MIRNHSRHGSRFPVTSGSASDPYWSSVSMLLHGDGTNAAQNNTFLDGSTNNFTVTRNGNTTQGSFNPFVSTYPYAVATNGGSAYFDGTGDYLTVPDNAAFTLGTNDFTIECWVYPTVAVNEYIAAQAGAAGSPAVTSFFLYMSSTGVPQFYVSIGGSFVAASCSITVSLNAWAHIACVRNVATIRIYGNGVQGATLSVSTGSILDSSGSLAIGTLGDLLTNPFAGYISNFRLVNGTCLYPSGTTFTPPTAPLTAVTNTALLLGMSNAAIFDNAELNNLETVANAQISTSVFKYGTGSMKFSTNTDWLSTPAKTAFALGSGDFTIEMWTYFNALSQQVFAGQTNATISALSFYMIIFGTGQLQCVIKDGVSVVQAASSVGAITATTWQHIAFTRDGNALRLYINGVQQPTVGNTTGFTVATSTDPLGVGGSLFLSSLMNGYIDDFRFTKGVCRYPGGTTFIPPTAAFPNS